MHQHRFETPDEDMFRLWRAVLALVHVDGELSPEEKDYTKQVTNIFSFSFRQRWTIKGDMKKNPDVEKLFKKIKHKEYRRQFFVMARNIIWCDGLLHEAEQKAVQQIVESIGDDAALFENELRWIDRKPTEDINGIIEQMSLFYRENTE